MNVVQVQLDRTEVNATGAEFARLIEKHHETFKQIYAALGAHAGCMCMIERPEGSEVIKLRPSKLMLDVNAGLIKANEALAAIVALFELHELETSGGAKQ